MAGNMVKATPSFVVGTPSHVVETGEKAGLRSMTRGNKSMGKVAWVATRGRLKARKQLLTGSCIGGSLLLKLKRSTLIQFKSTGSAVICLHWVIVILSQPVILF